MLSEPAENGGEISKIRLPLSTLLNAGYSVKLRGMLCQKCQTICTFVLIHKSNVRVTRSYPTFFCG